MIFVGIDNGVSGYIAEVNEKEQLLKLLPTPTTKVKKGKTKRTLFDLLAMRELVTRYAHLHRLWRGNLDGGQEVLIVIERGHAMPKSMSNPISDFNAGASQYAWEMACVMCRLPYICVAALSWQNKLLKEEQGKDTKVKSLAVAQKLFPKTQFKATEKSKVLNHNMSDAALLAVYGRRYGAESKS